MFVDLDSLKQAGGRLPLCCFKRMSVFVLLYILVGVRDNLKHTPSETYNYKVGIKKWPPENINSRTKEKQQTYCLAQSYKIMLVVLIKKHKL